MAKLSPQRKRATRIAVAAITALFVGVLVYWTFRIPLYECEVCIQFRGRSVCRTVQGATTAEARQGAITNACALLASGVTDTLACERTPPTKLECRQAE